ncbi:MAG: ATP-grasp domain-containing protein [Planctomycetaceae bacterium]
MRIFVSEYLCSGAWTEAHLPASLLAEGRAMRDALIADFIALPGIEVVTTCDRRVPPPPGRNVHLVFVDSPKQESLVFRQLCETTDAVYVIAPELDGLLDDRCRLAAKLSRRPLNSSPEAIRLCSDKWQLARHLNQHHIATLPTVSPYGETPFDRPAANRRDHVGDDAMTESEHSQEPWSIEDWGRSTPLVVKPRFGAGSQSIQMVLDQPELSAVLTRFPASPIEAQAIVQPCVAGRNLSVAAFFREDPSQPPFRLPLADQRLSEDGSFTYLGGSIPPSTKTSDVMSRSDLERRVDELLRQIALTIPGLRGYVGCDLLLPFDPSMQQESPLLLVEINPRLTTSYLGYRRLAVENLARFWIDNPPATIEWQLGRVHFDPHGGCRFT